MNSSIKKKFSWQEMKRALSQPKVWLMLALGFSSGLPYVLIGNTLILWLRESGIDLGTLGFISWVTIVYSWKFLWAPMVDKVKLPLLGNLFGLRRGWLLLSQIVIGLALFGISTTQPASNLGLIAVLAVIAAIASATQDIIVDAWRIEASNDTEEMALLSSTYQWGYRAAMLLTDALILILAAQMGWSFSYLAMALLMAVGISATFFVKEPKALNVKAPENGISLRAIYDAIIGPFLVFFKTHGNKALLMLAAVSLYRLADFVMGPMANPFYVDLGIAKETVGAIRGSVGLVTSMLGVAAGGLCAIRFGMKKTLLIGAFIGPASNLAFSAMALLGPSTEVFATAMAIDNFSAGFAGTALIGYMSGLTSIGYTATQYALLSSFYALPGKTLKGFSGVAIEQLKANGNELMQAYALFFLGTALVGIPAIICCLFLADSKKT
jgi:PAT family beta-lactamase induction signal transducer AmpG